MCFFVFFSKKLCPPSTSQKWKSWRFSLMEISHSCRCLPISCLNRWILSANLLELLEPLLFWPFLFCGVCAAGLLKLAVNSVNPKKNDRNYPQNSRKFPQNSRKYPQKPANQKKTFFGFFECDENMIFTAFMCDMVLKPLKWHEMTWNSWNYWNYWKAKTTGNFLEDESPGSIENNPCWSSWSSSFSSVVSRISSFNEHQKKKRSWKECHIFRIFPVTATALHEN